MNDYFIRCREADVPQLLALACLLGVLRPADAQGELTGECMPARPGIAWDVIGPIHRPTGETVEELGVEVPVLAPVLDDDGVPYWHANLRMPDSLLDVARARLEADPRPELQAALEQIPRWFVADEAGRAVAPTNPCRVFL